MTRTVPGRLVDGYDLVIFDLDGVVYLIDQPIPGAVAAVERLHADGIPIAYATNNASRRSAEVADLLTGMGVPASGVVLHLGCCGGGGAAGTTAARLRRPGGRCRCAACRGTGRRSAAGRARRRRAGGGRCRGTARSSTGLPWPRRASPSASAPSGSPRTPTGHCPARGPLPGNGALVAALCAALQRDPDVVVGKPESALFRTAAQLHGATRPLVVGDRLDTDIEGAVRAGLDSLLVLTGVDTVDDVLAAPAARRPTDIARQISPVSSSPARRCRCRCRPGRRYV